MLAVPDSLRVLVHVAACGFVMACATSRGMVDNRNVQDEIRQIERERLRALVEADMLLANELHASDFELVFPTGGRASKESYLTSIGTGRIDYRAWEPAEIAVRLYGDVALIRYRDVAFEVFVNGELGWEGLLTHTNLYEFRDGRWQIVWSQASGGRAPER